MEEELEKDSGRDMTPRLIGETYMKYPTERSSRKGRFGLYECAYCGNHWEVMVHSINSESTKSCGCQKYTGLITHGVTKHRLYYIWYSMIHRCTNDKSPAYKDYGGRGITVCEEWLDVKNFIEDMYPSYMEGLSLDRIDNDKGYSLDNCRWVDASTQAINRRIQKNNTSGFVGVRLNKNKWISVIKVGGKEHWIGAFITKEEATLARDNYIIENKLPYKLSTDYQKD